MRTVILIEGLPEIVIESNIDCKKEEQFDCVADILQKIPVNVGFIVEVKEFDNDIEQLKYNILSACDEAKRNKKNIKQAVEKIINEPLCTHKYYMDCIKLTHSSAPSTIYSIQNKTEIDYSRVVAIYYNGTKYVNK